MKTLTTDEKWTLVEAVTAVRDLSEVTLRSKSLSGPSWKDLSVMDEWIASLANLAKCAGAAYTFWQHATAAIKAHGADGVHWAEVEKNTIVESILEHGQSPTDVADAICQHGPGAMQKARQDELRVLAEALAPELQARHTKMRGEKGLSHAIGSGSGMAVFVTAHKAFWGQARMIEAGAL